MEVFHLCTLQTDEKRMILGKMCVCVYVFCGFIQIAFASKMREPNECNQITEKKTN